MFVAAWWCCCRSLFVGVCWFGVVGVCCLVLMFADGWPLVVGCCVFVVCSWLLLFGG